MIKFDFQGMRPSKDEIELFSAADFGFTKAQPDMDGILEIAGKYGDVKNLIIIARGGSVSTFRAFWHSVGKYISDKNVYFVDTPDPDHTFYVKDRCTKDDSLLVVISSSGETVDVIENMMTFSDYKQVIITKDNDNSLGEIAKKLALDVVFCQDVGDRFAGLLEIALFPAILCGLDISEMQKGAQDAYENYKKDQNDAKTLALLVKDLSDKGYNEIFWSIYSKKLAAFGELIAQLINESVSKEGRGISTIIAEGPESQHFLNQRFFGGPQNMIGFFATVTNFDEEEEVKVQNSLKDIKLRDGSIGQLEGIKLSDSMKFELQGMVQEARNKKIPSVVMDIEKVDERTIGYFTAFMQMFAVYLARAFEVNPFDQPEVEGSKKISFEARKNYKR